MEINRDHSKPTATLYKRGTNERLDVLLNDEDVVWIVQGSKGRRPILAVSKDEALAKYAAIERTGKKAA